MNGKENSDRRDDDKKAKRVPPWKTTGLDDDENEDSDTNTDRKNPPQHKIYSPGMKSSTSASLGSYSTMPSTVATGLMEPMTPMTTLSSMLFSPLDSKKMATVQSNKKSSTLQRRRQMLASKTYLLLFLSSTSFILFLYLYLPIIAFIALAILSSSTSLLSFTYYQRAMLEWENLMRGRGIGEYLPESLSTLLVESSLHEYMMDSSFFMEHRHLMLYFIPGITSEQIETFVDQLPPRHRNVLMRQGFGHFLGEPFMRTILGDNRYTPPPPVVHEQVEDFYLQTDESVETPHSPFTPIIASRRRVYNTLDEEGSDSQRPDEELVTVTLPTHEIVTTCAGPTAIPSSSIAAVDRERSEQEAEGNILDNAFAAMVESYAGSISSSIASRASVSVVQAVTYLSPIVVRAGIGLTTVSAGVGILGVWYGAYYPWRGANSSPSSLHFPSPWSLLSLAFSGGASATVMMGVRRYTSRTKSIIDDEADRERQSDKVQKKK